MRINNRIRFLRDEFQLTQKELADKIGLTPKMISFYEKGERIPPLDIVEKLMDIFNVSSDYLLGRTDDRTYQEQEEPFYTNQRERDLLKLYRDYEDSGYPATYAEKLDAFFPNIAFIEKCSGLEEQLLNDFNKLNEDDKYIIVGEVKKLLKEQRIHSSVAEDEEPLRKASGK